MPEANKNKPKPKAKLYFGNADELAKTNNYLTPEYLQEVDKRRKDWNEFVQFLKKENVAGSENLDKSGAGLGYLKKWNKANPDKTFTQEDIKDVQYFSRNTKKQTGERVNDGILGKVTSTFTFPDSKVNTYEMKDGKKVLVKSEEPNIGNYQYQADKINFGIAAKNKADVSKLPIYNKNSATTNIDWDKNDATASNLLKEQTKKRSLSGQSLSKPEQFVKPLVATENHPAVQEQLEGSYFDNNQKVVDYNQNLQQQKQAEVQQQADTRTALQKKLATSKSKDFTKEEALDYFVETGKVLPQNKVQAKYAKNEKGQILDINNNPLYRTEYTKRNFKNLGENIAKGISNEYTSNDGAYLKAAFFPAAISGIGMYSNAIDPGGDGKKLALLSGITSAGLTALPTLIGAGKGISKTLKRKPINVKNEEFGMPTFQDDAPNLTQKRQGGVIKDNRGQWAHPGKITEIGSNNITMQGVNYPVLGISDQGDTQMMYPEQNYQFKGNKVTEYPMMQNGGTLQENNNMEYGKGGYTVKKSSDRKGKTHVVIGPDGTKKYFGDPNLGERGKSKYGKEAFYARHKKNLDANPYFRAYARATWEDGGMIPEEGHISMNKRSLFKYGGLTVTDLNKYEDAGVIKPSSTSANVSAGIGIANAAMPMIEGLIPDKTYTDDEGNDLGSRKSVGESALGSAAQGAMLGANPALAAATGGLSIAAGAVIGGAYGAIKGFSEKDKMDKLQEEANTRINNKNINKRANASYNWGMPNINTSQEMQFARGGMVLDYNDPNANAELELQETFQMPNGQVGMVDGPSHENGGIAVDLPEGTRIWSDKLKYGGKTFAKHTKPITSKIARLEKEIEKAPINSEAKQNSVMLLNQQLDHYFDVQETNKEANEMKRTFKNGGMIKRADGSYSRRGLWDNIRANKGSGKKPTPQMLEQERKINNEMAMGGMLKKYEIGGPFEQDEEYLTGYGTTSVPTPYVPIEYDENSFPMGENPRSLSINTPYTQNANPVVNTNSYRTFYETNPNIPKGLSPEEAAKAGMGNLGFTPEAPGFFNKAGQFIQNNPGLIGQLGTAAITAGAQMNRVNKLARPRTLGDVRLTDKVVNPNLVDYSAERQAYNRMGLNAMGEAQRGFGSSAAAQAFKNKARLNTLEGTGKSYQSQENTNAQIRNQANMARQEAGMREAMMNNEIDKYNLENVYGYDENKMRDLNAITGQMGNVASQTFGNITANKNQLKQLEMLAKGNYKGVNRKTLDDLGIDDKTYEALTGQPAPKMYGGTIKRSLNMGGRLMGEPMYGEGGIHIKPENKGKFTAYAKSHGKGVQEMASAVLANKENYSPTIVKRANFAKNAAGWKHEDGGYVEYAEGGNVNPYNQVLNKVANFNTSKAAEQMDAEYSKALAGDKNIKWKSKDVYESSVTGLDYKVLPKAEKRALVVDMWRDAHGEAPTQKQIESGVKAIEGKKVTSPKAKTMAEIVEGRWKTGVATPEQMAAQMTPEEQEKYFLGIKDWGQFGKEQGAQMLDAVGSLGMSAIGNPLRSMFGTDLGFGSTDMSPEAVEAKVGNPNEYADAASNALIGIMGGKGLSMAANKIIPKFYKPAAKYFNAEARNLELQNAKKVYKANQSNKNQRAKAKYYAQVPEPDIPRYVRNIAGQEDEAFALEFGKRQKDALLKKIESKLNVAEGADRIRPKRSLKK
jgi:hypothetical protein